MKKYLRRDNFLILTILFIVAINFAIRHSEAPLVVSSKLIETLYVTANRNDLIYDILIGYICSYMFFALTVFIPDMNKQKRAERILADALKSFLEQLEKIVRLYEMIPADDGDKLIFYREYINSKWYARVFTTRTMGKDIEKEFIEKYHNVVENPSFIFLDDRIIELISKVPMDFWITMFTAEHAKSRIKNDDCMDETREIISGIKETNIFKTEYLIEEETDNKIIKQLVDNYRTYGYKYSINIKNELNV